MCIMYMYANQITDSTLKVLKIILCCFYILKLLYIVLAISVIDSEQKYYC